MPPSSREYLQHILAEADYILSQSNGLTKEVFLSDETRKRAFIRSLEIIGEATKQVPDTLRQRYSQIEWRNMTGMRDRLIHDYFGVDYDLVWNVVVSKIPHLAEQIRQLLDIEFPQADKQIWNTKS